MKNLVLSVSAVATALLTGSVIAAETATHGASAPSTATVTVVTNVVNRYVARESLTAATVVADGASAGMANLTLYPTADREVVFVTFETAGGLHRSHIALVKTHDGRVIEFTDFTGANGRSGVTALNAGDAQSQARSLLVAATPASRPVGYHVEPDQVRVSAQSQAADLLRPATVPTPATTRHVTIATMEHGDGQQMARGLMTASQGE